MMRKLTRRSAVRGSCARIGLTAALAMTAAACGTDSILDGGNGGGNGGGGGGGTPVGRTFHAAPSAAMIGDLVVDAARGVFYVSNKANNSIDMIDWSGQTLSRTGRALVGALPWGLDIDLTGDTLIVANSGGTSLSFVELGAFVEARRFNTPNAALWQLTPGEGDSTSASVVVTHLDFADKPQYIAGDASGVVFYSTQPTGVAPEGSVRMVQKDGSWSQRESDLVLWTQVLAPNGWGPGLPTPQPCYDPVTLANIHEPGCGIAYVDSVRIHYESPTLGTELRIYDHVPGFPNQVIADTSSSWYEIYNNLRARGSDIFMYIGTWNLDEWVNGDTTYLAAAGNRSWVTIAEGAREAGRVWLWGAIGPHPRLFDRWISDVVNIADYANNTSAPITGISVNHLGSVIGTRSGSSVFFMSNPMRLIGSYTAADVAGGAGVAVHPRATFDGADVAADWAVVGGAGAELIIVDTRHFRRVGRVTLMERVAGSLKVIDRLATDAPEVLGHVFGVMGSGRVFHTPITTSDINP